MANSRIMLTCIHCGEQMTLGKGDFGSYYTQNENIFVDLNKFFEKHKYGECSGVSNCSDNAREHFVILEKGEILDDLADVVRVETVRAWLYEMAFNNVGCVVGGDFSVVCEEIISRLDGLRNFARDRGD